MSRQTAPTHPHTNPPTHPDLHKLLPLSPPHIHTDIHHTTYKLPRPSVHAGSFLSLHPATLLDPLTARGCSTTCSVSWGKRTRIAKVRKSRNGKCWSLLSYTSSISVCNSVKATWKREGETHTHLLTYVHMHSMLHSTMTHYTACIPQLCIHCTGHKEHITHMQPETLQEEMFALQCLLTLLHIQYAQILIPGMYKA